MGLTPWWERLGVPYSMVAERAVERSVLVISHNAFLRRVLADFLEQAGATHVETRASADSALAQPIENVDLILADYSMQSENGLSLLKRIRTGETGFPPAVPFVFVLESAERWLVESAVQLDAGHCLLLPVNAQKVDDAMKLALRRERVQTRPEAYAQVDIEPPAAKPAATAKAAPQLPGCFARMLPGAALVPVRELARGMILGADLLSDRGLVLLVAGTALDLAGIGRLRHAADAFGFDEVPVVRRTEGNDA